MKNGSTRLPTRFILGLWPNLERLDVRYVKRWVVLDTKKDWVEATSSISLREQIGRLPLLVLSLSI